MSRTIWVDAPESGRTAPETWLLQDGTLVTHPKLEQTASGRRVRFEGSTTSVGINQVSDMIKKYVENEAVRLGSPLWMRMSTLDPATQLIGHAGGWVDDPKLYITDGQDLRRGSTSVIWEFRHPTLPIAAVITVRIEGAWNGAIVRSFMIHRSTYPGDGHEDAVLAYAESGPGIYWGNTRAYSPEGLAMSTWAQQHKNDPQALGHITWHQVHHSNLRKAVGDFFNRCRQVNELAQIHIPDMRDPNKPTWMALDLVRTNYGSDLDSQVADFVNVGPLIGQLKTATSNLVSTLRQVGLVIDDDVSDETLARVMSGEITTLDVDIKPDAPGEATDTAHKVTFNLATGTVAVTCLHASRSEREDAATAYENAKFMAELKGEEDEFLAYARAFIQKKAEAKTQEILDARAAIQNDLDTLARSLPGSTA